MAANITHSHYKFTKDMQNITKVRGEFRIYPKTLEKASILVMALNKVVRGWICCPKVTKSFQ